MSLRPNYFLAFRVYNGNIRNKVQEVQELAVKLEPNLKPTLINPATLHVTLAVTRLDNEEEVQNLAEHLNLWARERIKCLFTEPLTLNVHGIGSFPSKVLYAQIKQSESYDRFLELSKELRGVIKSAGFITDKDDLYPHLTILKLSKGRKNKVSKKEFSRIVEQILEHSEWDFGCETIEKIQLLSMLKHKDNSGYYFCSHDIDVTNQ